MIRHPVVGVLALLILLPLRVGAQSRAHQRSESFIIDPAYSSTAMLPAGQELRGSIPWIYGSGELEAWRLQLLMQRKDTAGLKVGYPGVYHQPARQVTFRIIPESPVTLEQLVMSRVGQGRVYINGRLAGNLRRNANSDTLALPGKTTVAELRVSLASADDLPALLIPEGPLATGSRLWEWQAGTGPWTPVTRYPQNTSAVPPHRLEDPTYEVEPVTLEDGLFDFGRELYGYIVIRSDVPPTLYFGESATEARDTINTVLEQTRTLVPYGPGRWRSKVPLAFRYAFLPGLKLEDLSCEAVIRPGRYKGAFASSDPLLNRIWMNSAYTLRLCMHDFLLDGMKRDRLPWTGDMAMSLLVNSYSFGDRELARRSFVALGRAGIEQADINGITDYSLWWIIAQDQYQLYYGDPDHLNREWGRIRRALEILDSRTDPKGFLRAGPQDWVFIDWVDQPKWTALQVMWWWAQRSAVALARRMGDSEMAQAWAGKSETLRKALYAEAWDPGRKAWSASPDSTAMFTRHPNFLAVVSGLTLPEQAGGIRDLLEEPSIPGVGTPYMAGFEMIARARLGNIDYALEKISEYWGGMIERGATSFWEAFDPTQQGPEQYAFYGRPYAKSLCHAWSSGPAAILPSQIFGMKPLEDAWREFSLDPNPGSLEWVSVSVPTPRGNIEVDIETGQLEVLVPEGTVLHLWGDQYEGPVRISKQLSSR